MKNKILNKKHSICTSVHPLNTIEVKKAQWASALNALMIHSGKTRSEMAEMTNTSKGRITRILSGDSNLTLETICNFANILGYDVDIAFYQTSLTKPYQPWNVGQTEFAIFRKLKNFMYEERVLTTISSNSPYDGLAIELSEQSSTYWLNIPKVESPCVKEFVF